MNNQLLRYIYTIFLGILIVSFVGLGIDTFYPKPDYPDYPAELEEYYQGCAEAVPSDSRLIKACSTEDAPENIKMLEKEYQDKSDQYQSVVNTYSRNVSIIGMAISIIILTISLIFVDKLGVLSDGILVGGILTLGYGIIFGFNSDDPRFRFITITVGLIVAVALGYIRFVAPHNQPEQTS